MTLWTLLKLYMNIKKSTKKDISLFIEQILSQFESAYEIGDAMQSG